MKIRFVFILVVMAALVGGAIVYVALREPARPASLAPPPVKDDAPAAPVASPNTSADYRKGQ